MDVVSFEKLALPTLEPPLPTNSSTVDGKSLSLIVIDEIGRMELHSERFKEAIERLLTCEAVPVFGAVTAPIYGHRVPFCDMVTANARVVSVDRITKKNRDDVRTDVERRVRRECAGLWKNHSDPSKAMRAAAGVSRHLATSSQGPDCV